MPFVFGLMIVRMVLSVLADSSGSGLFAAAAAGVCRCSRRHDAKFVVNFQVHFFLKRNLLLLLLLLPP